MKYTKSIIMTPDKIDKLESGEMTIQVGQWVQFNDNKKSRFVGVTPSGSLWFSHSRKHKNLYFFLSMRDNFKKHFSQ